MPYIWEEAEVFLEHGGVAVYHVYKNDFDTERREYWFGLTPNCRDEGDKDGEFDVRELEEWEADEIQWGTATGSVSAFLGNHITQVIKLAIDNGKLSNEEPYHHFKEE